jgi:threonine dehydratase
VTSADPSSSSKPAFSTEVLSPDMIREAAVRIRPLARRTPVMTSRSVDDRAGVRVFLKCENFQRGGAFKIRGASNLVLSLSAAELQRGIVAFSSGNHAQAVAIAAKHVDAAATIVMPEDAPRSKMEPTRALGAHIVTYNRFREDREKIAAEVLGRTGGVLAPPYDHPMIMAGQGTAALELLEEVPDLDALVMCVGGGGLAAGSATIAKAVRPGIRVFGVEPELGKDVWLSLAKGERVSIAPPETIADGLRTLSPGKLTFPILQKHLESVLLVSEEEIRATVRFLMERMKIIVEPSGAVGVAAAIFDKLPAGIQNAGVIVTGGNIDPDFLKTL